MGGWFVFWGLEGTLGFCFGVFVDVIWGLTSGATVVEIAAAFSGCLEFVEQRQICCVLLDLYRMSFVLIFLIGLLDHARSIGACQTTQLPAITEG